MKKHKSKTQTKNQVKKLTEQKSKNQRTQKEVKVNFRLTKQGKPITPSGPKQQKKTKHAKQRSK